MEKVDLKTKIATVYDYGLFVELAVKLAPFFKKVNYYCPWKSSFPQSGLAMIGDGIKGVNRIQNFYDVKEETSIFIFPDVYDGDLQLDLESQGYPVWGSRKGEEMELDRVAMMKWMQKNGLDVAPYEVVTGINELRKYLKTQDNVWVKVSAFRGDFESFHHEIFYKNYNLSTPKLDELEYKLGAKKYKEEFVVVQSIDDCVEIGYDGYTIDGKFPTKGICGIEIKDLGYIGKFMEYSAMAKEITHFNDVVSPLLKNYGYRGFFSTELRVTRDGKAYMIDACCRQGSPPGELYQNQYVNLAEIIWAGANGECIDPISAGTYGAEVMLHSQWADKNWLTVGFPEKIRDNVKFRNLTVINDDYWIVPQAVGLPEIGAAVAINDDMDKAMEEAKDYANQVKGYFLECKDTSMDAAKEELAKCEEFGIKLF